MSPIFVETADSSSIDSAVLPAQSPEELRELALRMYLGTDQHQQILLAQTRKRAASDRPLKRLALGHTIIAVIIAIALQRHLSDGEPLAILVVISNAAIAAGFWGLWAWSLFAPLPAAIVGLLMYLSLLSLEWASTPLRRRGMAVSPLIIIFRIWAFGTLIMAIIHGSRERAVLANAADEAAGKTKKPRSIASGIWLFVFLLSIVVIPRSLATDNNLNLKDVFDVHRLMAIVIIAWAIIAWRDTLPVIRNFGSLGWIGLGVLCGLGTFEVASIWGDTSSYLFGMEPAHLSQPFRAAGYSWLSIVALIALYPAIFEELAFRGIILPCLNRALTVNESIAVSGMMFMILHLTVPSAPPLLLAGIGLGFLRVRSKSLWPCVAMHFTHNAMCIAMECWK
jgi:uncharacterized protein